MTSVQDRLTAGAYALGWKLVCRLPEPVAARAFLSFGDLAWRRQGPRVTMLEANLRRVVGPQVSGKELRALSRAGLRSYARYWLEVFRLPVIGRDRIMAGMRLDGLAELDAALATGQGVVIALPHMGNYEQAGAWIVNHGGGRFSTVAERLQPESLYRHFLTFRESLGFEVLPATGEGHPFGVLAQRLRAGGVVCLVSDRDVTGRGIGVEFFGEPARMMAGPAALAVQTGAVLLPAALWFDGPGWGAKVYPAVPVPDTGTRREKVAEMTQQVARRFEEGIREHPEDWHMLQPVFTADLDPDRLATALARAGHGVDAAEPDRAG